jgi:hypothetical protein
MLPESELRQALATIALNTIVGPWTRAVSLAVALPSPPHPPFNPLWPGGPRQNGARYVPPGTFDALHLASDPVTATAEAEAPLRGPSGRFLLPDRSPKIYFSLIGTVGGILDLTDAAIRAGLDLSAVDLTSDWQLLRLRGDPIPTQLLGRVAYESGRITGIRFTSIQNPLEGHNVVVMTDRLVAERDRIEVFDPSGFFSGHLP